MPLPHYFRLASCLSLCIFVDFTALHSLNYVTNKKSNKGHFSPLYYLSLQHCNVLLLGVLFLFLFGSRHPSLGALKHPVCFLSGKKERAMACDCQENSGICREQRWPHVWYGNNTSSHLDAPTPQETSLAQNHLNSTVVFHLPGESVL